MNLIHCIYASSASPGFCEADIPALLESTRSRNMAEGVTGMLLFIEGSFFQVLEGDAAAVDAIFTRIGRDTRHGRVTQIIREPISRRSFDQWSMGFASIARADASALLGQNDFFRTASCLEGIDSGRAKKLLVAFGEGRWRTEHTGVHPAHVRVA